MGMVKDFFGSLFGGAKEQPEPNYAAYELPEQTDKRRANVMTASEAQMRSMKTRAARRMGKTTDLTKRSRLASMVNRNRRGPGGLA